MIDDRAAGSPDADLMRQVRRRWASGVAVVATRDHKEMIGTTVSAFSVLSLDPPLVLICLYEEGRIASVVGRTRRFSVSRNRLRIGLRGEVRRLTVISPACASSRPERANRR